MKTVLVALIAMTLSPMAFSFCAEAYNDTLDKMRSAEKSIRKAQVLYSHRKYDAAIRKALSAKERAWEGGVEFESQLRRGTCDWEGPSISDLKRMIGNTKITQNRARCVIYLSKMDRSFDALGKGNTTLTSEQRNKKKDLIRANGKKALDVCEQEQFQHIRTTLALF